MAASKTVVARMKDLGMGLLQPAAGLAALEHLLAGPAPLQAGLMAAATVDVVPFVWRHMLARRSVTQELFQGVADWHRDDVSLARSSSPAVTTVERVVLPTSTSESASQRQIRLMASITAAVANVVGRTVRAAESWSAGGM